MTLRFKKTALAVAVLVLAAAFTGYHLVALAVRGHTAFIGAIVGAALVLWVWRMMR